MRGWPGLRTARVFKTRWMLLACERTFAFACMMHTSKWITDIHEKAEVDRKAKEEGERKDREKEAAEEVERKAKDESHRLAVGRSLSARQNKCPRGKRMPST